MKGLKFLTICLIVLCLFSGNLLAICGPRLDDDSFPSEGTYVLGDTIEYVIELSIPDDPNYCDLQNFRAFFLNPTTFGTEACEHPDAIELQVDSPFVHGSFAYFDSSTIPELSYVIQEADLVEIDGFPGKYIVANVCASWLPDSDSKTLYNRVMNPCVQVTKEACGWSKEGDVITYDITITNCGDCTISLYDADGALVGSVEDSKLGDLTQVAIKAGGDVLAPDQNCMFSYEYPVTAADQPGPVKNKITVKYATCVDEPDLDIVFVDDDDTAEVQLIHPDFSVSVDCNSIDETTACFDILVTNKGDVPLNITDGMGPLPDIGLLGIDQSYAMAACVDSMPDGPCRYIADLEINAVGTIPEEYCGLPNELERSDSGHCEIDVPCGDEGCTPGFWKNHPDCWCDMYAPDMLVSDVWTALNDPVYDGFDGDTLMDALNYGGGKGLDGKVRNLLRHATAGLLNACNGNVNYPLSQETIINAGNAALESMDVNVIQEVHMFLAGLNEDSPCPIDAHCRVIEDDDDMY